MCTPAQLPDDVIVEILLRLPVHCIARCRAVCRAWRSAISHPSFDRSHAERPAAVAKITINLERYICGAEGTRLLTRKLSRVVVFDLFPGHWLRDRGAPSPLCTLGFATSWYAFVLGSWDGVVCIERGIFPHRCIHFYVDHYVLWNPLTMAYATVDTPDTRGNIIGGYAHPETRRFHLLQASGKTRGDLLIFPTIFRIRRVGDAFWRQLPFPGNSSQPAEFCMKTHGPRFVRLHGNLHWLVESSGSGTLQLLAFDTTREEFWSIETPPARRSPPADIAMARFGLLSGSKLCIFAVEPSTSTMEMWVLHRYSGRHRGPGSWQLKERIGLITLDRSVLSWTLGMTIEVEVVQGVREGQEIFLIQRAQNRIDVYNVQRKEWRMVKVPRMTFTRDVWLVMHRESFLDAEVSFGEASRAPSCLVGRHRFYCL